MKPTLLILAAGMGSRYGGLKQMDELGPGGESIIDYSIYDAIKAGFGKVVFVIRESFASDFRQRFEPRLNGRIETEYVFQELNKLPNGFAVPEGREKPWGTGHAMLMARYVIKGPFAIINADDFYGREAYIQAIEFIENSKSDYEYAMIGYALENTLSDHGTVSRGICNTDDKNYLTKVVERTKIGLEGGKIFFYEENQKEELNGKAPVSMNFWIFKPSFINHLETGFTDFLKEKGTELRSEFYFNAMADRLIKENKASTKIINTNARWFGVTYREDRPIVIENINNLIANGVYPKLLWK